MTVSELFATKVADTVSDLFTNSKTHNSYKAQGLTKISQGTSLGVKVTFAGLRTEPICCCQIFVTGGILNGRMLRRIQPAADTRQVEPTHGGSHEETCRCTLKRFSQGGVD